MDMKNLKQKIIRRLMSLFFKKIVKVEEEWMYGDKIISRRRKVDVITLECNHRYWAEKVQGEWNWDEGEYDKVIVNVGDERICDACLLAYLENKFKYGANYFKFYDKHLRKLI